MYSSPALLGTHSNPQYQHRLPFLLFVVKICRQPLEVLNCHHSGDTLRRWPHLQDPVYIRLLTSTLLHHPCLFLNLSFIDLLVLLIGEVYLRLRIGRISVYTTILTTIRGFHLPALLWLLLPRHMQRMIIMA